MQVDHYPVGMCRPGCQPGFYPLRFNGTCRECPKDCRVCRDKTMTERVISKEIGIENQIYCIQCKEKGGERLYTNKSTGECVNQCEGFGMFSYSKTTSNSKIEAESGLVCSRCFDKHCQDCNQNESQKACILCKQGYVTEAGGACAKFFDSTRGMMIIVSAITFIIAVIIIAVLLIVYRLMNQKSTKPKYKTNRRLFGKYELENDPGKSHRTIWTQKY